MSIQNVHPDSPSRVRLAPVVDVSDPINLRGRSCYLFFSFDFCRDIDRRRASMVRSWVEGVVAFGVERETLARFIAVANETEIASREREALEEAMETLRRSARRWGNTFRRPVPTYIRF